MHMIKAVNMRIEMQNRCLLCEKDEVGGWHYTIGPCMSPVGNKEL
jgi:hypothetical protein